MRENFMYWKRGVKDGFPICLGYIAVSFTFGIMAKKMGLSLVQAVLISGTNFTSAGQFAGLDVIAAGGTYVEMAMTQLIINLRYCLMSCSLSQKIDPNAKFFHRFLIAFGNTDEVFGVSSSVEGRLKPAYSYGVISIALPGWIFGTFLGVVSGNILSDRILSALGVALYGMFIAIVIPPARENKILTGIVAVSVLLSFLFSKISIFSKISSGFKIIILTILIAGVAAALFPVEDEKNAA